MIVAGFGCRSSATELSLRNALERTGMAGDVAALASVSDKTELAAMQDISKALNLPLYSIDQSALPTASTQTDSPLVRRLRHTGSVAEASALLAAGPGAELLCARVVSDDRLATCAIASAATKKESP